MNIDYNISYRIRDFKVFSKKETSMIVLFPDVPYWIATTNEGLSFLQEIDGKQSLKCIAEKVLGIWNENTISILDEFLLPLIQTEVLYTPDYASNNSNYLPTKPNKITFLQTMDCNLRCKHCSVSDHSEKRIPSMDIEKAKIALRNVIEIMDEGEKSLAFLGGEPLMGNKFSELLDFAYELGFKIGLSTNGILIDEEFAKKAKKYNISVQISLDGPTRESHEYIRGKNTWDRAITAINILQKYDVDMQTNMVYHKGNFHLIEEYFRFCKEHGIKKIRLISLMKLGRAADNLDRVPTDVLVDKISSMLEVDPELVNLLDYTSFMGIVMVAKFSQKSISCGAGIITLTISPEGDVYPCLNIYSNEYKFCNLFEDTYIDDYYNSQARKIFQSIHINHMNGKCGNCDIRHYCAGRCRGETLQITGDLSAPSPYCEEWKKSLEKIFWLLTKYPELGESRYYEILNRAKEYIGFC